mgnify:FL=1
MSEQELRRAGLLAIRRILGSGVAMTVNDPDLIEAVEILGLDRRFTSGDIHDALAATTVLAHPLPPSDPGDPESVEEATIAYYGNRSPLPPDVEDIEKHVVFAPLSEAAMSCAGTHHGTIRVLLNSLRVTQGGRGWTGMNDKPRDIIRERNEQICQPCHLGWHRGDRYHQQTCECPCTKKVKP